MLCGAGRERERLPLPRQSDLKFTNRLHNHNFITIKNNYKFFNLRPIPTQYYSIKLIDIFGGTPSFMSISTPLKASSPSCSLA